MQPIIHSNIVQTDKWEEIKSLKLTHLTLNGYYTMPLFTNDDNTVKLIDLEGKGQGELAVTSLNIKNENGNIISQIEFTYIPKYPSCSCNGNCKCNC